MQLLSAHDLRLHFVEREIFDNVGFGVENGAHIGLTGANGCGKTSLFRIITGELPPSSGQVVRCRETRLAYMEQFLPAEQGDTLTRAVLRVFAPLLALEARLERINRELSAPGAAASEALLQEQHRLQERYAELGGYTYRARLRSTLLALGFSEADLELPVSALSGGQRSKAALAKVLLSDANLLLLDEPTNHLDIASIEWLETYLTGLKSAFIVISHDRWFLDRIATETWAMHHQRLACYQGNYTAHLEKRESEEEAVRRRYLNQQREIRRIQGVIEQQKRFNQARNYITIASKQKQIRRLQAELTAPEQADRTLHFRFNVPPPGGNDVLELHGVAKSFGGKTIFENAGLLIRKGERVFLLGENGCGKSTLCKIIMGREQPDQGMVRPGINIHIAYYDQLHDQLNGTESILRHFTDAYPRLTQTETRTMLGSFLFSGEAVDKAIRDLSGGEKARLTLMELMLAPANFLLLDEPTNHLDIDSCEALETALLQYPGTMLIISHDRYLVNRLADRIYYMTPHGLTESLGNYDDWLARQAPAIVAANREDQGAENGPSGAGDYRRRKEQQAEQRREQKLRERRQAELARLEAELDGVEAGLNDPRNASDYQRLMALQRQKEELEEAMLALLEQLEAGGPAAAEEP